MLNNDDFFDNSDNMNDDIFSRGLNNIQNNSNEGETVSNSFADLNIDVFEMNSINSSDINTSTFYECRDCQTKFGMYSDNQVDSCIYCGGYHIQSLSGLDNDVYGYIPFVVSEKDAVNDYKKKVMMNPLIPLVFKRKKTIQAIHKIYLPISLLDINLAGDVIFLGADKNKVVKNHEKVVETQKYEMVYTTNFDYNHISLSMYSKIDNISQYNFNNIKSFSLEEVKDVPYILGDLNKEDIFNKVCNMVTKNSLSMIRENINHSLKKLKSNNMNIDFKSSKNLLVPIYFLDIEYRGTHYLYIMNGESGFSTIQLTFGKLEMILVSLILFVVIFIISFLISYFL